MSALVEMVVANSTPILAANNGIDVHLNTFTALTTSELQVTDADNTSAEIIYTITSLGGSYYTSTATLGLDSDGNGEIDGSELLNVGDTFSQADIDAGRVYAASNGYGIPVPTFDVSDGAGGSISGVGFRVQAYTNAPEVTVNTGLTLNQNSDAAITTDQLLIVDPDTSESYTATLALVNFSGPLHGILWFDENNNGVRDDGETLPEAQRAGFDYTADDLKSGRLHYEAGGGFGTDKISVWVVDPWGMGVTTYFNITVNAVPEVATNIGITGDEGATVTITATNLEVNDDDNTDSQIIYTIDSAVQHGTLWVDTDHDGVIDSGEVLGVGAHFTQADLINGLVHYSHDGGETTSDSFGFDVSDGVGGSVSDQTFAITITPVNDAPVKAGGGGPLSCFEGSSTDTNSYANVTTTQLDVTDADNTASELTYTVTSFSGTFWLDANDNHSIDSGELIGHGGTFTQADVDAGKVYFGGVDDGPSVVSPTLQVLDPSGAGITNIGFTFLALNQAPGLAGGGTLSVSEGDDRDITSAELGFGTDPSTADNAAGLRVILVTAPQHGTLMIGDEVFPVGQTYASGMAEDFGGARLHYEAGTEDDSFKIALVDKDGGYSVETFTIDVNRLPVLEANAGVSGDEGAFTQITSADLRVSDPDNTSSELVYTIASDGGATLGLDADNDGKIEAGERLNSGGTFTQADIDAGKVYLEADDDGTYQVTLSVSDGAGGSLRNIAFDASLANLPPQVTVNTGLTLDEDSDITITSSQLQASDPGITDNASLHFLLTSAPEHGYLWYDANNDGVREGGEEITASTDPSVGLMDASWISSGRLHYHAGSNSDLDDPFQLEFLDTNGATAVVTVDVSINPVNDAPTLDNSGLTLDEGAQATITSAQLAFDDVDNTDAEITFTLDTTATHGTLWLDANHDGEKEDGEELIAGGTFTQADIDDGWLHYKHDGGEATSDGFTFDVSDGSGGVVRNQSITITVTPINDAPVLATNAGLTLNEGAQATITAAQLDVNDVDNTDSQITYTVGTTTAHGTLWLDADGDNIEDANEKLTSDSSFTQADIAGGRLHYTHDGEETTSDGFTFTVSDGAGGAIGSQSFTISISAENDAPTLATPLADQTSEEDHAIRFALPGAFTDPDSTLTFAAILANGDELPSWLSFNTATGGFSGRPPRNFNGVLDITVTASDGNASVSDTFRLTIDPVNDAPTGLSLAGRSVTENDKTGTVVGTLSADDVDGDRLAYSLTGNPDGLFKLVGSKLEVAKDIDYEEVGGKLTVKIRVADPDGLSATESFTIAVRNIADDVTGTKHDDKPLTGSALGEKLFGLAGDDTIKGLGGADELHGGAGNDLLFGGVGHDSFVFDTKLGASNVDRIEDFSAGDEIWLDSSVFRQIETKSGAHAGSGHPAALQANQFHIGAAAADADDRIIYNSKSGSLFYDADGTGHLKAVLFAHIGHETLDAGDFFVV